MPLGRISNFVFYQEGRDLNDIQLAQFLQGVQGDRNVRVIQAPKLTVFNGQKAKISITEEFTFLARFNVDHGGGKVVAQPGIDSAALGSRFQVRPTVSSDRTHVNLNLGVYLANLEGPVPMIPINTLDAD